MRFLLIVLIKIYQWTISPLMGRNCRFYPTCSEYGLTAIRRFGALKGGWLALKRIGKCGPWHPGGVDEVPKKRREG